MLEDADDDTCTLDDVEAHLTSKFWWLPGATTSVFRDDLVSLFERLRPEIVAPSCGGVIRGAERVRAHLELIVEVLDRCAAAEPAYPEPQPSLRGAVR